MPLQLIDKAFFLKKTELFKSFDLEILLSISDKIDEESFKRGNVIFDKGQEATFLYFIVQGQVLIKYGEKEISLSMNDFFGEEAILSGKPRAYRAEAQTDLICLLLSQFHFVSILRECPEVALTLLEAYSDSLECRKG